MYIKRNIDPSHKNLVQDAVKSIMEHSKHGSSILNRADIYTCRYVVKYVGTHLNQEFLSFELEGEV